MNQRAFAAAVLVATLATALLAPSCCPTSLAPAPAPRASAPADPGAPAVAPGPAAAPAPSATKTLTVRVVAQHGDAPIAKAKVTVATGGDEAPGPSASAETDAEGRARIALPADAGGPFDVTVLAAGWMRFRTSLEESELPPEIVARLGPAGCVRGVVRGADGKPVEGADVFVEFDEDQADVDEATSAADGAFALDGVPLGKKFDLVALGNSDQGDRRMARRKGLSIESADRPVAADLTLAEPAEVSVRVLWADGLPIAGASVVLDPGPADASSGEDGTASPAPVPAQHQTITVRCWGFSDARAELDLSPGEKKTITLHPAPGPTISGVVVDEKERPVADVLVRPFADGAPGVRTRADGVFRIACPDESPVALKLDAPGCEKTELVVVDPPAHDLRIVVHPVRKVRCRLVWPPGAARTTHVVAWIEGKRLEATIDGDVLRIDLPPATKRVLVSVKGFAMIERDLDADAGAVHDWGDVVLVPAPRLEGRVVDAGGKPVHAFVHAKVGDATVPLTSTGDDGTFSVDGLPAGDAEVRVEAEGFVNRTVHHTLAAGGPPLTVALARGGGVRGIVVDADGTPAPKVVYVSFVDLSAPQDRDRMASPSVGDDGRFEVRLAPGRYRASTTLDAAEATAEVDVADGKTVEITLKLGAR